MTATVSFTCKDPLIVKYFEDFGPRGRRPTEKAPAWDKQLTEELNGCRMVDGDENALQADWEQRLTAEAKLQEWYDYTESPHPAFREPVLNDDGTPKLLVPTVVIIDE